MHNIEINRGYTDYLSLPSTNCIKGIFALFVMVHHLYQYSGLFHNTYLGGILQGLGYVSVAMFFFLSGYGLHISRRTKGIAYVKSIPRNRMFPLYVQCVFLIVAYALLYLVIGKELTPVLILQSLTWGKTIIFGGWYLQAILVLYALYYLVYGVLEQHTARQKEHVSHIIMFAVLVLYALLNVGLGKAITYYQSIFAFLLGILWCDYRTVIDEILQKRWVASFVCALMLFAISFVVGLLFKPVTLIAAPMFVIFALIALMKLPVQCGVTRWLGKYYFEIYVMQGISLLLFHSELIHIENKWLYVLVCTLTTLLLAVAIQPVFRFISSIVKGKRTHQ